MLNSNSHIRDCQRVSVLAAAAFASDVEDVATATIEHFIQSILYRSVASVVKQCDDKRHNDDTPLRGNLGSATHGKHNGKFKNRKKMT